MEKKKIFINLESKVKAIKVTWEAAGEVWLQIAY